MFRPNDDLQGNKAENDQIAFDLDFSDLVELLRLCESASEHPLAKAIIAKAKRVNMS